VLQTGGDPLPTQAFAVWAIGFTARYAARARSLVVLVFVFATCLTTAAPAFGQEDPNKSTEIPPELREHYTSIIRAQAVLIQIPRLIMQDDALKAEHLAFEAALLEAMTAQDAANRRQLERFDELQRLAVASPGGQQGLDEGRRLRDALLATATSVLGRPTVTAAATPLMASLTTAFEQLEGVDGETLSIVTDEALLLETVAAMTVFAR